MSNESFTAVTAAENIAEKSFSCFQVKDVALVICRFRNKYFALENQCSHAQSAFDDGRLRAYNLICPLHGASFDIRNGTPTGLPARLSIKSFPVRVTDGVLEVNI
jgi:3-phenylpropionate/trans-cinnamate dioxygenase ferredoxin subunit